jgi:hypothetical protein
MPDKHRFHVVLADGTERDVVADDYDTAAGVLTFLNAKQRAVVAYAPGVWKLVEHESRDDRKLAATEDDDEDEDDETPATSPRGGR